MPVNLMPPEADELLPVPGVRLGTAAAGIKYDDRDDVTLIQLDAGTQIAGVFTTNRFCAAPVTIAKAHLAEADSIRALVINTGNANAGTGQTGIDHARQTCQAMAALLNCEPNQVLPFSTGVILEPLPVHQLIQALPKAQTAAIEHNWRTAADAILTTDIVAKGISRQITLHGQTITITGISKGSGMIHPNMATMLAYIATDAPIAAPLLQQMLQQINQQSFNCICVDGDTSTNDAFMLMATGKADIAEINHPDSDEALCLQQALTDIAIYLAQAIVRDGEGATKFITVHVEGGRDYQECKQIGYALARSPLVKTAFFASDPNLGRLLAAIGYAGIDDLDVDQVQLYLDETLVAEQGGRAATYQESTGQRIMQQNEISVTIKLHRGQARATLWTCDFSYDYVKINADYRS